MSASRLREIRLARGVSQTALAGRAGCALRTVRHLDHGTKLGAVQLGTLVRLAAVLEVPPVAILPGLGAVPPAKPRGELVEVRPSSRRGKRRAGLKPFEL